MNLLCPAPSKKRGLYPPYPIPSCSNYVMFDGAGLFILELSMATIKVAESVHPTIEQAYDELSTRAFAVWIRLMVATPKELSSGKAKLAKICNYSVAGFYLVIAELHNKRYISYTGSTKPWQSHTIWLAKRCLIAGRTNFVQLSNLGKVK